MDKKISSSDEATKMMDDKIIFKPEKGTASYNPLIDNIKDTNTQEAFAEAKRFASVLGMKHCSSIGLILFVRFSKTIPKKDKTLARLKEIKKSGFLSKERLFAVKKQHLQAQVSNTHKNHRNVEKHLVAQNNFALFPFRLAH